MLPRLILLLISALDFTDGVDGANGWLAGVEGSDLVVVSIRMMMVDAKMVKVAWWWWRCCWLVKRERERGGRERERERVEMGGCFEFLMLGEEREQKRCEGFTVTWRGDGGWLVSFFIYFPFFLHSFVNRSRGSGLRVVFGFLT